MLFVLMTLFQDPLVIKNGKIPKSMATFEMTLDLVFGDKGEQQAPFFWPSTNTSIAANDRGEIFVCDPSEQVIWRFDKTGQPLGQLGGKGNGPGEFTHLTSFQFLQDNRAVAFEIAPGVLPKMTFFDAELKFIERKNTSQFEVIPTQALFSPDASRFLGNYVSMDMSSGKMVTASGLLSLDYHVLQTFSQRSQPYHPEKMMDPQFFQQFIGNAVKNIVEGSSQMTFDSEGAMYIARSYRYEIEKWDAMGKRPISVIQKAFQPKVMQQAYIDYLIDSQVQQWQKTPGLGEIVTTTFVADAIEKAELKRIARPIQGLITTEQGVILAVSDLDMRTGVQIADAFTPEGEWVARLKIKDWPFMGPDGSVRMVFRNGFAYTLLTSPDETHQVARFKVNFKPAPAL